MDFTCVNNVYILLKLRSTYLCCIHPTEEGDRHESRNPKNFWTPPITIPPASGYANTPAEHCTHLVRASEGTLCVFGQLGLYRRPEFVLHWGSRLLGVMSEKAKSATSEDHRDRDVSEPASIEGHTTVDINTGEVVWEPEEVRLSNLVWEQRGGVEVASSFSPTPKEVETANNTHTHTYARNSGRKQRSNTSERTRTRGKYKPLCPRCLAASRWMSAIRWRRSEF